MTSVLQDFGQAMQNASANIAMWNGWVVFLAIGVGLMIIVAVYDYLNR